ALLRERLADEAPVAPDLWHGAGGLVDAETLASQVEELPEGLLPIVVAGGSFNSDGRRTRLREESRRLIDELLETADPDKCFFVLGHRLGGCEGYLLRQNRGRFRVFAIVPGRLTRAERDRLQRGGAALRLSVEPNGSGLYKSFASEIFKRRPSVLLAFDGNSPGANLVQEAKNARVRCTIYVDPHSRALQAKARMLKGYVRPLGEGEGTARAIAERHGILRGE
ncbi:MAG: hypothetical protein K6G17_06165, partial [Oscillospiraceae bacterium]|nr:hypothetical protein [Oscillospiraceae bacterium]